MLKKKWLEIKAIEKEQLLIKRVDAVGIDIYAKRSGKCLERKYNKRFGNRNIRV